MPQQQTAFLNCKCTMHDLNKWPFLELQVHHTRLNNMQIFLLGTKQRFARISDMHSLNHLLASSNFLGFHMEKTFITVKVAFFFKCTTHDGKTKKYYKFGLEPLRQPFIYCIQRAFFVLTHLCLLSPSTEKCNNR